ncbi:hypothetical protein DFQ28_008915 [Apophysomyces sp. BC1034]|nr:hypothetical protein DFQ30_008564 [Apophysomyces sp. BC1015]KAG0174343.1 hypothetical protein DFQ29_007524 [Apophysomyces sp. BC1021]KAG0185731.1 hypothetical protein DFQ28_008915 [Apophysomyces sp. BC1034]
MNKLLLSSEYMNDYPVQQYPTKLELADQPTMMYPGKYIKKKSKRKIELNMSAFVHAASPFYQAGNGGSFYDHTLGHQFTTFQPGSPDSFMSGMGPTTPPPPAMGIAQEPPMLVASSSSSTTASANSAAYLNETIAKASSLPESFYPEFLQYSKETYEQSTGGGPQRKKRRYTEDDDTKSFCEQQQLSLEDDGSDDRSIQSGGPVSTAEMRRQIHIQSEQKRRAQIKDGFEDLRNELPACLNKKMSKVALLHRTVQHIQHLKSTQMTILAELERLVHENEQLRAFQQSVLQRQALENMYSVNNL